MPILPDQLTNNIYHHNNYMYERQLPCHNPNYKPQAHSAREYFPCNDSFETCLTDNASLPLEVSVPICDHSGNKKHPLQFLLGNDAKYESHGCMKQHTLFQLGLQTHLVLLRILYNHITPRMIITYYI